tara:strand:- start:2357 stop:2521 length:165 start_codon:yes stop_codon:yes gene_type:complete
MIEKLLTHLKLSQNLLDEFEDIEGGFNSHAKSVRKQIKEIIYEAENFIDKEIAV